MQMWSNLMNVFYMEMLDGCLEKDRIIEIKQVVQRERDFLEKKQIWGK